jgi:hypothetical protein
LREAVISPIDDNGMPWNHLFYFLSIVRIVSGPRKERRNPIPAGELMRK